MEIIPNTIGIFYPDCGEQLVKLFERLSRNQNNFASRLIIVPHAGYEYSARIAFKTYSCLDKNVDNVVVIAPAIYAKVFGIVSCDAESFKTPIGNVSVSAYKSDINNKLFVTEPAFSVQLPFIKYFFPKASVTPVLYGCEDYKVITEVIENNISNSAIVIVSNLSRFLPEREVLKLDTEISRKILKLQLDDLDSELADGAIGICAAIEYAKSKGLKLIKIGQSNSSVYNKDTSNVVGYGGWYLTQ